jgi:CelD/BcsL family acetyltransferase involved in cellulose biosynthesis
MKRVARPAVLDPAPYAGVTVEVHRDLSSCESLWRALSRETPCSIHHGHDWCRAWIEATGAEARIAVGYQGSTPLFLLPLELHRVAGLPVVRLIGTAHSNLAFGPHAARFSRAPDEQSRAALVAALRHALPGCHAVLLEKMPAQWLGHDNPWLAFQTIANQNNAFQISLHTDFEDVLAQVNRKRRRKKFRNAERALIDAGGYDVTVAETADEARALLDLFFDQKAGRLAEQGLTDPFATQTVRSFLHSLAAESLQSDVKTLQLWALRLRSDPSAVAAIVGLSAIDGRFTAQFGSIDDTVAPNVSVGELLYHHIIERCCGPEAKVFDFGIGDQAYKHSWCDIERVHYDVHIPLTPVGKMLCAALRQATAAKRAIKQRPALEKEARRIAAPFRKA